MNKKKASQKLVEEYCEALNELINTIAKTFKIEIIAEWLENKLRKLLK